MDRPGPYGFGWVSAFTPLERVGFIFQSGPSNELSGLVQDNRDAFLEAAREGRLDAVERLLDEQVHINCVDDEQLTPLQLAAEAGHVEMIRLLIEHGANVEAGDKVDAAALVHAAMTRQRNCSFSTD